MVLANYINIIILFIHTYTCTSVSSETLFIYSSALLHVSAVLGHHQGTFISLKQLHCILHYI
jgi:hypothetical protein